MGGCAVRPDAVMQAVDEWISAPAAAAAVAVLAMHGLDVLVAGVRNRHGQALLGDLRGVEDDRCLVCIERGGGGLHALDGAQDGVDLGGAGRALEAAYFQCFGLQGGPLDGFALHDVLVVGSEPGCNIPSGQMGIDVFYIYLYGRLV